MFLRPTITCTVELYTFMEISYGKHVIYVLVQILWAWKYGRYPNTHKVYNTLYNVILIPNTYV
jgi:hypothetical protein